MTTSLTNGQGIRSDTSPKRISKLSKIIKRVYRSSIQSTKTRSGADCGSIMNSLFRLTKFRLKLKKVGKNTRPFRYDLNQIPYNCTVKVRNRFKGLDLIECLKNYEQRFVTLFRRQ